VLIDWFTVGAQAVNFLVLVGLLKHFLFKPILSAIDAREKLVAGRLASASAEEKKASCEREELQQKNADIDARRAALLKTATDEATAAKVSLEAAARRTADALRASQEATRRDDARALEHALRGRVQHEVFAIARKTLGDLADVSLESRVMAVFLQRLEGLPRPARAVFAAALKKDAQPAVVRTAFELTAEQRAALQEAVNQAFSVEARLHVEVAPELVSGIEIATTGEKLGWNILEYLGLLEKAVGDLLATNDHAAAQAAPPTGDSNPPAAPKAKPDTSPVPLARPSDDAKAVGVAESKSP
jgi:F-type H+-transporting ATPase subunit b